MSVFTKRAVDVFAPTTAAGQPRGADMGDAMVWGTEIERIVDGSLFNGGLIYDTKSSLKGDLAHDANASAWVVADGANNGIYRKIGASGTGSWTKIAELPYSVIYAQNAGTGTADAVEAISTVPISTIPHAQLISVPFTAANTSAMTLSINGETPRPLVTNVGAAIPAGYVQAGMAALVQIDGDGNYRLFSYGDASAIQAAAEAAQLAAEDAADRAESAAAGVEYPVSYAPQTLTPEQQEQARENIGIASLTDAVADRTKLKALDTAKVAAAYLTEAGREGQFLWVGTNLTSLILGSNLASTSVAGDVITKANHGLNTGHAVVVTSAVNGLSTNTLYYVIWVDYDNFKLAASYADAHAGTAVTLTGTDPITVRQHHDPCQGFYVCPDADITGASGAWVRQNAERADVRLFGASTSASDNAEAFQGALDFAGKALRTVYIPGDFAQWVVKSNLVVPVGKTAIGPVSIEGDGWSSSRVLFDGPAVTKGFWFHLGDSAIHYCGTIKGLRIEGTNGAYTGLTFRSVNHPRVERCVVAGFDGPGATFDHYTLMTMFDQVLMGGNGQSGTAQLVIDRCTTFMWLHSRISGGGATGTACGVEIDSSGPITFFGGAIESTGLPLKISSKPGRATAGVSDLVISGLDIENPGDGNPYIEIGKNWDGSAGRALVGAEISMVGALSGTTDVPYALYAEHTVDLHINQMLAFLNPSTAVCRFFLAGTGNSGTIIQRHERFYGDGIPYVMAGAGTHDVIAHPRAVYDSNNLAPPPIRSGSARPMSGASPTIRINTAQGGWGDIWSVDNGSATDMTALTGAREGMVVSLIAANGNTTIKYGTGTNQFQTKSGSDLTMEAGKLYQFIYLVNHWYEI